jgi:hypothetical protein
MCVQCRVCVLSFTGICSYDSDVPYIGLQTDVLFVRRILVGTRYISVGKFHFDYMCLLFSLLVLGGYFIVSVVLNAIYMCVRE